MMKTAIGILFVVLALVIGIVPIFTDCQSQGRAIELANGKTIPMKCHWTGRAEVAVAVPLAGVGILFLLGRRKETRRALAVVAALLGLMAILLPAWLIGVCSAAEMVCKMTMEPILMLAGVLTVVLSGVALWVSRGPEAG
jgi:hypothetical protein